MAVLGSAIVALAAGVPAAAASSRLVAFSPGGETRVIAEADRGFEALRVVPSGDAVLVMEPSADGVRVRNRVELATGLRTRLPGTADGRGSFSPDGSRVFAETGRAELGRAVLRTAEGERLRSWSPTVADLPMSGLWSRDGRRLLMLDQRDRERRSFRLRVVDARTGTTRFSQTIAGQPRTGRESSSPAGDRLAVALGRNGTQELRAALLSLRTGRRVSLKRSTHVPPAFSPDGRRIAVSVADGSLDIVNAATVALERRIPTPDVVATELTWSPDGAEVAFVSVDAALFTCRFACAADPIRTGLAIAHIADGRVEQAAAHGPRSIGEPAWTPDGRAIIAVCRTQVPTGC